MKILGILEFAVLTNLLISLICQAPFQQECFFKASVPTTAAAAATITLRMTASQHFFRWLSLVKLAHHIYFFSTRKPEFMCAFVLHT